MRELLNQTAMAKSCNVAARNFQNWGVMPVATDGRQKFYSVRAVLDNRLADQAARYEATIAQLQARITELETDEDGQTMAEVMLQQHTERRRLLAAQAEAQEMKNEMARHETAPFAFITFLLAQAANHISGVLDSMPTELVRIGSLTSTDLDRVRGLTAAAADRMCQLGDESWVADQFNAYLQQFDK